MSNNQTKNQAATGMSIDTPEFRKLLCVVVAPPGWNERLIAHIDAHTADLRAQLDEANRLLSFCGASTPGAQWNPVDSQLARQGQGVLEALDGLQRLIHENSFKEDGGFAVRNCLGSFGLIRAALREPTAQSEVPTVCLACSGDNCPTCSVVAQVGEQPAAVQILRGALIEARAALGHPDNIAAIDRALAAAEASAQPDRGAAPTAKQQAALQALADQAQELDMGYGPAAPHSQPVRGVPDGLRQSLEDLCAALPDVLPDSAGARYRSTGKWAQGNSYAQRGHTGTVTYRADDMECVYAALDAAIAMLAALPQGSQPHSTASD